MTDGREEPVYEQSAVIPFRHREGKLEVLLITSIKARRWILPKGIVENGLSPWDSAAKEAFEEAGVTGEVHSHLLGRYEYRKWDGVCRVRVFPLAVRRELDTWPEGELRERKWLGLAEAASTVREREVGQMIAELPQALERLGLGGGQGPTDRRGRKR